MLLFLSHPAKNITTAEGGLIVTQHQSLDSTFKLLRAGGVQRINSTQFSKANYLVKEVSSNYHMTELQAVLGLEQLKSVDSFIARRRSISSLYFSRHKSSFVVSSEISRGILLESFRYSDSIPHSFKGESVCLSSRQWYWLLLSLPSSASICRYLWCPNKRFPCANEYSKGNYSSYWTSSS